MSYSLEIYTTHVQAQLFFVRNYGGSQMIVFLGFQIKLLGVQPIP